MSMINVIVKTLDGRNHDFSVPDDITVMQFKNIIHEKMEIPIDRQRLLFQGRVLQDDNLLSFYNVAGNVMHLVTRPPPSQNRPQPETNNEREENSDINRDQIRNILSDVFGNIAELSNPLGVSVNNEGNRVDITVNMPSTNRLSLARLRQNYIHRLMSQARELVENLRDPTNNAPRPDRDRLYQANAYDLAPNEERITEVTAQPLPIHNLADMIHSVRDLWRDSEPQLELWENVLRRQSLPDSISSSDREMQRMHDSASRYIHLFSHMLHIMSDYLVEFQHNSNSRIAVPRSTTAVAAEPQTVLPTNEAATSTSIDDNMIPLTGAFGESGLPHSDDSHSETHPSVAATAGSDSSSSTNDRSRYLYVFSEMPAQLLQVRLDVDSTIQMPGTGAATQTRTQSTTRSQAPQPEPQINTTDSTAEPAATARSRRREAQFGGPTAMENLFRTTIHESTARLNGAAAAGAAAARSMRTGSHQLIENVDPYVRCQSRHFQNPSNLRSGAVISTIGGLRFRESSRTRHRPAATGAGAADIPLTTTAGSGVGTGSNIDVTGAADGSAAHNAANENRDGDPIRSFIGGLINSIFSTSAGDTNAAYGPMMTGSHMVGGAADTTAATAPSAPRAATIQATTGPAQGTAASIGSVTNTLPVNEFTRLLQTLSTSSNDSIGQLFPEIFHSYGDGANGTNNITNQIIHLVVSRLTMIDFTQIFNGVYQPLNVLRIPLQNLLQRHQQECDGSRDRMLEHLVMDLEFFNRVYTSIFERLRAPGSVAGLSDDARSNFNRSIDIPRTINNLNRHHARVVVDMILRSPTDIGFGQLLMNSMFSHHEESLALLDIICNQNAELRQYMVRAFTESLMGSFGESASIVTGEHNYAATLLLLDDSNLSSSSSSSSSTGPRNMFSFEWIFNNVNSRLFRTPDQLPELRETVLSSYVVLVDVGHADTNPETVVNDANTAAATVVIDDNEQSMDSTESIDDIVNTLSGNIINGRVISEVTRPRESVVSDHLMDVCNYQQEVTNHTPNGASWQSVLPPDWLDIVSRDSNMPVDQQTIGIPYSDAYVSGMPPKRRKIILNQRHRSIQPVPEIMHDCIDQAIRAVGIHDVQNLQPFAPSLTSAFQGLVSDHVRNRLVEESFNFPADRFPSVEQNFTRKKRQEEDKKNN